MPNTTEETTRPCDECGTESPYEPIMVGDSDIGRFAPHICDKCTRQAKEAEAQKRTDERKRKRIETWEATIPLEYRQTDLDHPDFNMKLWKAVQRMRLTDKLALIGPSGRCKTRVMALLAWEYIRRDRRVGWCTANQFQWAAQREFDPVEGSEARRLMRHWKNCSVLFLDDLGKHRWTDTVESAFFDLVGYRHDHKQLTHWSMNNAPSDEVCRQTLTLDAAGIIQRALDPDGQASRRARLAPIVSRLTDDFTLIPVV